MMKKNMRPPKTAGMHNKKKITGKSSITFTVNVIISSTFSLYCVFVPCRSWMPHVLWYF